MADLKDGHMKATPSAERLLAVSDCDRDVIDLVSDCESERPASAKRLRPSNWTHNEDGSRTEDTEISQIVEVDMAENHLNVPGEISATSNGNYTENPLSLSGSQQKTTDYGNVISKKRKRKKGKTKFPKNYTKDVIELSNLEEEEVLSDTDEFHEDFHRDFENGTLFNDKHFSNYRPSTFHCLLCKFKSPSDQGLSAHLVNTHGRRRLECAHCAYQTFHETLMNDHFKFRHPDLDLVCIPRLLPKSEPPDQAQEEDDEDSEVDCEDGKCIISDFKTVDRNTLNLRMHMNSESVFICERCGFQTDRKLLLKKHIVSIHMKQSQNC